MKYIHIKSNRRTASIQIKSGEIIVRTPLNFSKEKADKFVFEHLDWINKHINKKTTDFTSLITKQQMKELKKKLSVIIPKKVEYFSNLTGLKPTSVKITSAKTRFGSCNGKNAICFSGMLVLFPDAAIDYVVLHEIAHIKHHNHSKRFYELIEKYMPDYKERQKLLKLNPFDKVDNN